MTVVGLRLSVYGCRLSVIGCRLSVYSQEIQSSCPQSQDQVTTPIIAVDSATTRGMTGVVVRNDKMYDGRRSPNRRPTTPSSSFRAPIYVISSAHPVISNTHLCHFERSEKSAFSTFEARCSLSVLVCPSFLRPLYRQNCLFCPGYKSAIHCNTPRSRSYHSLN